MKTILLLLLMAINNVIAYSQLPHTYPFKAISDTMGNIYVAGQLNNINTNSLDYSVTNIPRVGFSWDYFFQNNLDNDRATDVVVTKELSTIYIYATGFIMNGSGKIEIVTTKLNLDRDLIWQKNYTLPNEDCKGLGITIDANGNPWITGYTTINSQKNILSLEYSKHGTLLSTHTYSNPNFTGDNVGTSIMADNGHVYVMGYTYNGPVFKKDLILLSYNLLTGDTAVNIYTLPNDQMPTAFKFAEVSRVISQKSRVVVTSVSDLIGVNPSRSTEFFTVYYDGGVKNNLLWARSFYRKHSSENVPTALDVDSKGSVYLTGYTKTKNAGYDFTTIKYLPNGSYGWTDTVKYFDELYGNDKASSIRVHGRYLYITGPCERTPGSYKTIAYSLSGTSNSDILWTRSFIPSFMDVRSSGLERAAVLCLDTINGTVSTVTMQWGNNEDSPSNFAIQSYDRQGNEVFTYDNGTGDNSNIRSNSDQKEEATKNISSQNFPNPFNPSTVIKFTVPKDGIVKIRVYDISGKEIAVLTDGFMSKGHHEVEFNSSTYSGLTSGIYFYKIESGSLSEVRKMIMVK